MTLPLVTLGMLESASAPELPPVTPVAPTGLFPASVAVSGTADYGTDVSTFPDLDDTFAQLSGPAVVAQHIARSLADSRYGVDLRQWLNDDFDAAKVFELEAAIEGQCLDDERVASATVTVTQPDMYSLQVTIQLSLLTGQTFAMVLQVSQVSVELLSVSAGA